MKVPARISTEGFLAFCDTLTGQELRTRTGRAAFTVARLDSGLVFTPASTGQPRQHTRPYVDRVLDEFARTGSWATADYRFTINASYMLSLIHLMLQRPAEKAGAQGQLPLDGQEPVMTKSALETISQSIQADRDAVIGQGKAAFDAADPRRAHRQAERLERLAEAEELLGRLSALLGVLGIEVTPAAATPIPASPPAVEPPPEPPSAPGPRRGGPRLPEGPAHQPHTYYEAVLAELAEHSQPIHLKELLVALEPRVRHFLNVSDLGSLPNHGKKRWQYVVQWALTQLKDQGRVENPKRGFWKLRRG